MNKRDVLKCAVAASLLCLGLSAQAASRVVTIGFGPCHTTAGVAIPSDAANLVRNSVEWVTDYAPAASANILIVADDMLAGYAASCDPAFIEASLKYYGYNSVTVMSEPVNGLKPGAVAGYDAIVLVGESFEVDDLRTVRVLLAAHLDGIGLVLTGDDVSWNKGGVAYPNPTHALPGWRVLTRLKPIDNGEGLASDTISITDPSHPVMTGSSTPVGTMTTIPDCAASTPCTANDIDTTTPLPGAQVLAVSSKTYGGTPIPAVIAWGH